MEHAILSNINLCQRSGDTELKESTVVAMIEALLKGTTITNIPRPRYIWCKIKAQNSVIPELRKEQTRELWRQMWTTVKTFYEWYDRWQSLCLKFGFGDDDGNGGITFCDNNKRWIVNMEETQFSTDGSHGGIGGRPGNSITMLGVARAGTAFNKSIMSSTLICGSNTVGESLLIHVMFSLDTQEENYQVDARWLANFPCVCARFGDEDEQDFCDQVAVNEIGGTYDRVLHQSLSCYTERLYADAAKGMTGDRETGQGNVGRLSSSWCLPFSGCA
jgi:hypothetical protein